MSDALYDSRGRNLKEQRSRQNKMPWITVKYHWGRMVIPNEIKHLVNHTNIVLFK